MVQRRHRKGRENKDEKKDWIKNTTKRPSRKLRETNRGKGYLTYKPGKGDICTQNTFHRSSDATENRSVRVVLTFRSTVENHCPSARSYLVKQ